MKGQRLRATVQEGEGQSPEQRWASPRAQHRGRSTRASGHQEDFSEEVAPVWASEDGLDLEAGNWVEKSVRITQPKDLFGS